MIALEISVNGSVCCVVGTAPNHRVVSSMVSWTHRDPDQFCLQVVGAPQADQHLTWDMPEVSLGDEITIRIVETDRVDEPDDVRPKLDYL